MLNRQLQVVTDTATIAVFDEFVIQHRRVWERGDWWCEDIAQVEEVRSGDIALFGLGSDGIYQVRVTDGELTPDERHMRG